VPFGNSSWNSSVSTIPDDPAPPLGGAMYMGSADLLETLGVTLVAGRDFTPDEYVEFDAMQASTAHMPSVIVTRGIAERLYPGKTALGRPVYIWGNEPQIIVGVIDHLARPNDGKPGEQDYAFVLPVFVPYTAGGTYLLRVAPERRAEVLSAIDATLTRVDPNRIISGSKMFTELRGDYFKQDRSMAGLLIGVCIALLIVTALGVIGLASFWVQQRTRQIGTRRALGATRRDIVRYFQTENFILATIGIIIGMALAYAINLWLMSKYQVSRLPAEFLPFGALLLWGLGQVAVLGPALRAASIPPAIATRSV